MYICIHGISPSYSDESPLIPNEFLHEPHITAQDLGGEPILGLMLENEPDLWIQAVPSNVKRSLKEKQVGSQTCTNHSCIHAHAYTTHNCILLNYFGFAASGAARVYL